MLKLGKFLIELLRYIAYTNDLIDNRAQELDEGFVARRGKWNTGRP